MASEHKRIVERLEALERSYDEDKELRRVHCEHHKRLEERQKALEESVSFLDKVVARKPFVEHVLAAHNNLSRDVSDRLSKIEARLASKPDDFGGVTSTGAPKPMTRWVIVSGENALSPGHGFVPRGWRTGGVRPAFFKTVAEAETVRSLLFPVWGGVPAPGFTKSRSSSATVGSSRPAMRNPRLRDVDGTEYDPETGQRVALTDEQIEGARWEAFEMVIINDDDVDADHG